MALHGMQISRAVCTRDSNELFYSSLQSERLLRGEIQCLAHCLPYLNGGKIESVEHEGTPKDALPVLVLLH